MADRDRYFYRSALLLLIVGLGCYAIFNSGLLHMLFRKRDAGAEVEEEEEQVPGESLLEKQEGNQLISSSDLETVEVPAENNDSTDQGMEVERNENKMQDIDEDLHSPQLPVYGRETTRQLFASNVLISGLNGLGAEIGKNIALAGVKSITLHDEDDVQVWDLSSNFLLSEDDIGKNRALACVQKLQELNNAVMISTITEKFSKEHLSNFQAVVFTDPDLEEAIEFDEFCHNHQPPIAFIKSEVRGLFGSIFCDFGQDFTVFDVDGEEPHASFVASISNENPASVYCIDDERLEFQDGDLVVFAEVKGMNELNDGKPRKVKNVRPYSFILEEDTTNFGIYEKGGIVTQVKLLKILDFKPLRVALKEPGEYLRSDFSKYDRPLLLHLAFQALDKFRHDLGRFPGVGSVVDAQKLIDLVASININLGDAKLEQIDDKLLHHFASGSRAILNSMAAMFGGIVGQEVVKACSGKFHPLFQFFYFDSVESLPVELLEADDLKTLNCRYDAQISVFGSKLQKKLEEAKVFMVGSGALGCEFLKNLALMGVCCSQNGKLTLTDDDVIEKSNLSRQFLFRDWNIGQAKSSVAAAAASLINPALHVEAFKNQAKPETEDVFNDAFWEGLNVVINTMDNVDTKMYIDMRCVYFQKPLLVSGTLGAKCNSQVAIPHLTENYGASRDPPAKRAPLCTVYSFPNNIDHCLTWARSEFERFLEKTPNEVNKFLFNPTEYASSMRRVGDAKARDLLERVFECLEKERCETFHDCITWARLKFEEYFTNRVKQLTFTFPDDSVTSTGTPFWSVPKRFPHPLQFSSSDPGHLQFIMSASILKANSSGIPVPDWGKNTKMLADAVDKVIVPDFEPPKDATIITDENETGPSIASMDETDVIENLIAKLKVCAKKLPPGFRLNPIQFEKDDDTNYHMDFIVGLANMLARIHNIPEIDKLKAKFTSDTTIPNSTALIAGLLCLELYKVLSGGHNRKHYRNTSVNLALPFFSIAEPASPKEFKYRNMKWTLWDRWIMQRDLTLKELLIWLYDKGLNPYSISCGSSLLYNSMFTRHKERLKKKIVDLAREVGEVEVPPYRRYLDLVVVCEDGKDSDVNIPLISIPLR